MKILSPFAGVSGMVNPYNGFHIVERCVKVKPRRHRRTRSVAIAVRNLPSLYICPSILKLYGGPASFSIRIFDILSTPEDIERRPKETSTNSLNSRRRPRITFCSAIKRSRCWIRPGLCSSISQRQKRAPGGGCAQSPATHRRLAAQ